MGKYAEKTTVSPDRTLMEIRQTLLRYGATKFGLIEQEGQVGIGFEMQNRRVRFTIALPEAGEVRVKVNQHRSRVARPDSDAHQQAVRQKWRALLLVIKSKLESIESGIETIDEAFMAQMILPSGQTMAEWATPQVEQIYLGGKMPPLLPGG